jgi:hypothetical protein
LQNPTTNQSITILIQYIYIFLYSNPYLTSAYKSSTSNSSKYRTPHSSGGPSVAARLFAYRNATQTQQQLQKQQKEKEKLEKQLRSKSPSAASDRSEGYAVSNLIFS